MIKRRSSSSVVIIFPQNEQMKYGRTNAHEYLGRIELKNMLTEFQGIINYFLNNYNLKLMYENTLTKIGNENIESAFYFDTVNNIVTRSCKSNKATTIKIGQNIIISTLYLDSQEKILDFSNFIGLISKVAEKPEWVKEIIFLDDEEQIDLIVENEEKIKELDSLIKVSQNKLDQNDMYKSVLYENGNELVKVVFDMIENMIGCSLTEFMDENHEDFLIKLENVTFIGEIKGVTTNVRSEYISQLDVHYQSYLDNLKDQGVTENVKALLIINHQRNNNITNRSSVHKDQIKLAERNNSLIIDTRELLKMFEQYKLERISSEEIIEKFQTEKGLLFIV